MNIGVIGNADPILPLGLIDKLQDLTGDQDDFVHIDARKKSLPRGLDLVLLVTTTMGHAQLDRFVKLCRRKDVPYIRSPHHWSTLVAHCRRVGINLDPQEVVPAADPVVVEVIEVDPDELETAGLRTRLEHAEREAELLRTAAQVLRSRQERPRKLDHPTAPMQDRSALDPSQLLRLWRLARCPRRQARMNILCTAIEVGLDVDVELMIQRVERS